MSTIPPEGQQAGSMQPKPGYSQWGDPRADAHHMARSVDHHAAFFVPHLKTGTHLLDCGCGPGTITVGLARLVAPGQVIGVDPDESALNRARKLAEERQVENVRFEAGDVYSLPYPDNSFDAVFSHALFEHLQNPHEALEEIYRVLKYGGVVGIRLPDVDGWLISPPNPLIEQWIQAGDAYRTAQGADMHRAKHMRRFLREAGFVEIIMSASYDSHGTPETVQAHVERRFPSTDDPSQYPFVEAGFVDAATMRRMYTAWRTWAQDPDAFLARSFCEVIGWKP